MKAPSPRQSAKVLAPVLLAAWLSASPINTPCVFAVTRTEVQMGDPDIGDLAPKKAAVMRLNEKPYRYASRLTFWLEVARAIHFRPYWF